MNNLKAPLSIESRFANAIVDYIVNDIGTDPNKIINYTERNKTADGVIVEKVHDSNTVAVHVDEKGRHIFKNKFIMNKKVRDYLDSLDTLDLTDDEKMDKINQLVDRILDDKRVESSMNQLNANIYEQEKAKGNVNHPSRNGDYVKKRLKIALKFSILAPLTQKGKIAAGTIDQRTVRRDFDTILFASSPMVHSVEESEINLKTKHGYDYDHAKYYQHGGKKGRDRIFIYQDKNKTDDNGKKVLNIEIVAKLPEKKVPGEKSSKFQRFHITDKQVPGIEALAARHEELVAWRKDYEVENVNFAKDDLYRSQMMALKNVEQEMSDKVESYLNNKRFNIIKENAAADKVKKDNIGREKKAADIVKNTWQDRDNLNSVQRKKDSLDGIRTELKQNTLATIHQQVARCQTQEEIDIVNEKMEELCKKGSGELREFRYNKVNDPTTAWEEYLFIIQSKKLQLKNNASSKPISPKQFLQQRFERLKNLNQLRNRGLVSNYISQALMLCEDAGDVQSLKDELFRKNNDGSYVYLDLVDKPDSKHMYPICNEKGDLKWTTKQANAIMNLFDAQMVRMWKGQGPNTLTSQQKQFISEVERQQKKKERGFNKAANQVRITESNNLNLAENYSSKEVTANTINQRVMGAKGAAALRQKLMLAKIIWEARSDVNQDRRLHRLNKIEQMILADKNSDYSPSGKNLEENLAAYAGQIVEQAEDQIEDCCDIIAPDEMDNNMVAVSDIDENIVISAAKIPDKEEYNIPNYYNLNFFDEVDDNISNIDAMIKSLDPLANDAAKQQSQANLSIVDNYHDYEKEVGSEYLLMADLNLYIAINMALHEQPGPNRTRKLQALDKSLARNRGDEYIQYGPRDNLANIEQDLKSFATILFYHVEENMEESGNYNMKIPAQMNSGKEKADEMIHQLKNQIVGFENVDADVDRQQNDDEDTEQLPQLEQQKNDLDFAQEIFDLLIMEKNPDMDKYEYFAEMAVLDEKLSERDDNYVKHEFLDGKGRIDQIALRDARQQLCEFAVQTIEKTEKDASADYKAKQHDADDMLRNMKQRAVDLKQDVQQHIDDIEDNMVIIGNEMDVTKGGEQVVISVSSDDPKHEELPFFNKNKVANADDNLKSDQSVDAAKSIKHQ